MEKTNMISFLSQLFFAYISLVAFITGMGRPIFRNHDKFFNRPEIILAAGYFFISHSLGSKSLALSAVMLYYVTTIASNNIIDTYNDAFGFLSPLAINFAEYIGFLEKDDTDIDSDFDEDSDSDFD